MRQKHYDIDYVLGMITIKQSTREPLQYLVLLWVVTAAVVLAAVLGRLQIIQFNLQWLVDCIALLFLCSIVVMTYRTVFPIDFETVVRPDAVDLSSTSKAARHAEFTRMTSSTSSSGDESGTDRACSLIMCVMFNAMDKPV